MEDTIVIIASHSGSTFASLAVSNLMQAFTQKIFVIASEFDTQVMRKLGTSKRVKSDLTIMNRTTHFTDIKAIAEAEPYRRGLGFTVLCVYHQRWDEAS